jgi:protocatechuate 3,4-dioxygenase beta subunit
MSMRTFAAFVVTALGSIVCAAQTPPPFPPGFPQAPRDRPTATGTAIIRGHVLDAASGRPLKKAQVRAASPELRENRLAITDNNGAYELKNLAAGRYQLTANKGAFVSLQYGQTRPFEQGKPLEVRDAQLLEKIDFSLPRGAVVTGRVVDEIGEPTSDAQVMIQRYQYVNGRRQLFPVRSAQTNDIGEYRLFGIPPGQFVISAVFRGGDILGLDGAPNDNRSGYAPTFYPGTTNATEAQRVTLAVAQTLNDINIPLSPTRMARISGTAVNAEGKPIAGLLILLQAGGTSIQSIGNQIKPDGSFTVSGVAPGDYTLLALVTNNNAASIATAESAQLDLTVAGEDVTDVRLVGVKPSTVTGRIVAGSSVGNLSQLQLVAAPKIPTPVGGSISHVNDDGTFEMFARLGLAYIRMNPTGSFAGVRIKSVRLNGVDVTDSGIDFKPNETITGLEVELTTQLSSLSGGVTDAKGNAVKDYTIVTFARDREKWGPASRYLNSGRPDQDGKYKLVSLPPGDYYAIALDFVEQGTSTDPDFLERAKERATAFSMTEAETKTLDLKLVAGM